MAEYFTPDTLLDDTLDELREAREMVRFLTRANEALAAECDELRSVLLATEDKESAAVRLIKRVYARFEDAKAEIDQMRAAIDDVVGGRAMVGLSAYDAMKWAKQRLNAIPHTRRSPMEHERDDQ